MTAIIVAPAPLLAQKFEEVVDPSVVPVSYDTVAYGPDYNPDLGWIQILTPPFARILWTDLDSPVSS